MGEKEGEGKKRRKSNYSAGIIINSQLVPWNYSFEGHSVGEGEGQAKEKKRGRKRQFR